ncbi:MAG TPA: FmdE family protein [Methanoculleus sp.]|nr:FmdE family protein [Methanoculleus sp.]
MCNTTPSGRSREAHDRFAEAAAFHGHICPGLATGYRAAEIALSRLCSGRSEDEELVTITETDACGVDAIQVLTGCTAGKGNLLFKDYGKHAFTFINRRTGAAVRVAANPSFNIDSLDPDLAPLRARVMQRVATEEELAEFHERVHRVVDAILEAPAEQLFTVREVDIKIPERARIFSSVPCAKCGEMTAESRVRVEAGKFLCYACSEEYSRRW